MINPDPTWNAIGVSEQELRTIAERLGDRNNLPPLVHRFFEQASSLMLYAWYSYPFASIAFFHAVIGVEKVLRLAYDAGPKDSFKELFEKAVDEGIIHDGVFREITPIEWESLTQRVPKRLQSHAAFLASLVPRLRNDYLHGEFIMALEFVQLSLRLREIADAIAASSQLDKALKPHAWRG